MAAGSAAASPRPRSPGGAGATLLRAAAVAAALACLLPLAYLGLRAIEAGPAEIARHVLRAEAGVLLLRSLGLALAVAASASLVALPLAWLTVRRRLPAEPVWAALFSAPLAIPSYVGSLLFIAALGPRGVVREGLAAAGFDSLPDVYGFGGAWAVLTLLTFPYVYLPVRGALLRAPDALEEAARSLGAGPVETFLRVVLPQARPALAAGALLAALYTLADFGAVSLLRCSTFTRVIYLEYHSAFDRTAAALDAGLLTAAAVALVAAEHFLRGRHPVFTRRVASVPRPRPLRGAAKAGALALGGAVALVVVAAPVLVLATWSSRGGWTRATVASVLEVSGGAVGVAIGAALIAGAVALPVAVTSVRRRGPWGALAERAAFTGFALPGIVFGLAFVHLSVRYAPPLYQTLPLLVLAYTLHFLPQAVGAQRGSLLQIDPQVEEAGRSLGRSPSAVFRSVTLPLAAPGILAGWLLVFLTTIKELPATLLLAPAGFQTLATRIWSLTEEAHYAPAAVHAVFLLALSGGVTVGVLRLARGAESLHP